MKKVLALIICILLSVSILLSLTSCSNSEKEIENLMSEFEYACNTLDFDAVLECIKPSIADNFKLGASLIGSLLHMDTDEMFDSLALLLSSDDIGGADFFSSVKIEVNKITIDKEDDESAIVSTYISYNLYGTPMERKAKFHCIYYIDKWCISSFAIE